MQCILIGVTPSGSDDPIDPTKLWNAATQHVVEVNCAPVKWIASSTAHDEGKLTQLLCAKTAAPVDDVIAATSRILGDVYSCELWASAPAIIPLRPLIGYEAHLLHDNDDQGFSSLEDFSASAMKEWGMFAQSDLIDSDEVEALRRCVTEEIASIEELLRIHKPDINVGKDIMSFQEISSRGNNRFDLLLHPTSKARDFVENIILDRISSMIGNTLDGSLNGDIDFDISVVYSKPGAPNQGWHADGDHQKGAKDEGWEIDGWKKQLAQPYALCLFIPLIDLDAKTGFTQFWPASHRNRGLMGFGQVAEITEATWDGKCKAGDAIWYDYRLMHRGMGNSSDVLRPVVQVLFRKSWYVERRNYGTESLGNLVVQ